MSKWTKGPWAVESLGDFDAGIRIGDTLAVVDRVHRDDENCLISRSEMVANANLIAAAPELYEYLEEAAEELVFCLDTIDEMTRRSKEFHEGPWATILDEKVDNCKRVFRPDLVELLKKARGKS